MDTMQPEWPRIGPLPTDPTLEKRLDEVKQVNDHQEADESVWLERSRANAQLYAAAEEQFFKELDKQLKPDEKQASGRAAPLEYPVGSN